MDKAELKTTKTTISILYYFLAVVFISAAFFVHELTDPITSEYDTLYQEYKDSKEPRKKALTVVKNLSKGTPEYEAYLTTKKNTAIAFKKLKQQEEADKILGFDNLNQFLGELGWALGITFYSLLMLILTYYKSRTSKGEYILHGTLLFIGLFYVYYTIRTTQDYSKFTYMFAAFVSSTAIVLATHFLLKEKRYYIQSLLRNIRNLVGFVLNNTKKESEEEKWNILEKVADHE